MLGGDDQQIVSHAGDGHAGEVERFGIDQAVGGNVEELAEGGGVHVGQSESRLLAVEAGAGVVVVVGENVLGVNGRGAQGGEEQERW